LAKPIETNPYVADPEKGAEMIRQQVLESSFFEGAIHLTKKDLPLPLKAPVSEPRRKTA
jgi:hypothetical protein